MTVVFGLGSGRCGTKSLAALLNAQPGTVCFHEANPSAMAWAGAEDTVFSLLRDFRAILDDDERAITVDRASPDRTEPLKRLHALPRVEVIGDVGIYYLPYVTQILSRFPEARFPCLQRDRTEVIKSYVRKLGVPHRSPPAAGTVRDALRGLLRPKPTQSLVQPSRNHWCGDADRRWVPDRRWDKCFPSYDDLGSASLADHIARFYDDYYGQVDELASRYPENVRVFPMESLNSVDGRADILRFCRGGRTVVDVEVFENEGASPKSIELSRRTKAAASRASSSH
ncbi:hypothetical protein L0V05_13075 [Tabrizicola sp. J26]|uniref:hypothetical protein n=1 Tax=Alitabrizicola rongguiensis TaxID=2909234 RepID=UPI001F32B557|nr:hypothetical protein [Tabrizicola rongguiensis]MCF1709747.1 hypothetical protein [Tabrizicola rongguiensis]